ncbi:mucin-4-like isoform X3 [Hypanus sabinus]|uniref:mucin-4-like isoform X3 n=1 Tax=Hypanus sabinus TaxID=79690 RepID=UPI0028C40E1F|nr:mucin-4-like isoform X3 [Hypanus sabinus]
MLTRRRTLRSGGPVSAREEEAQEDDLPKMQQPQRGVLQSTPFTRSRYRKVEQVSEDISPRRSPCVTSAGKSPKALQLKEKAICGIPLPQEDVNGNSTLTENNDLPKLWLTETPAAKLEKDVKKPVPRKSLRIAKMLNLSTSVNIDSSCMPGGGTKSEEHVDASCEPAVMKQTEMQSPKKKEKTEAVKVDQESLDEGKVVRRSSRVTVTSPSSVRERESSSAKSKCKKELHSESGSDGAMAADSKNSYSDKEVQTVIWKITLGAEEELTPHDPETKDGLLLQDTGDTTSTSSALRNGGDISSPRKARGTSSSPSPRKAGISSSSSPSPSISKVVVTSSSPNKAIDVFLSSTHSTRRTRVISSSSPSLRNAKDVSSSPSLRKAEDVSSSPSLRKAEDVSSSPSLRKDEDVSSPSLRKAKDVSSSPSLRKAKDVSSSPSLRKAKDVSSPSLRKAKDTSSSPSLRKAKDISPSPSLRSAKDISSSPSLRKAKDISPSPSLRSAKDVSSPSLRKAKDVSSTPSPRKTREAASCSPRKAGDTASPSFPPKAGKTSFPSPSPMKAGDTACPLFPQKAGEPPFSSPSPLMVGDTASSPSPLKAGDTASSPSPLKAGDATSSPSPLKAMGTTSDNSPLKAGGTVSSLLPLKAKGTASTPSPLKTGLTASSPSPLKARDTASSPSPRKTDSHRKSQESAAKEMPLIKTWNLRRQSLKLGFGRQEEETERMEAECSAETLTASESHEDGTDVAASEYLPLGAECGPSTDGFVKKPENGEKPVMHTNSSYGENHELLNEANGNPKSMAEWTQFAGEVGTFSVNVSPTTKPADSGPSASRGNLQSVSPGRCICRKAYTLEACITRSKMDESNSSGSQVLKTEAAQTGVHESVISMPECGGTALPEVAISKLGAEESNLPEAAVSHLKAEGKAHPKISKPEDGEANVPGSLTLIAEGKGLDCAKLPISGSEDEHLNLPEAPVTDSETERKAHHGMAVSKPEDGGIKHEVCTMPGELNYLRTAIPEPGTGGSFHSGKTLSVAEDVELIFTESDAADPESERKNPFNSSVSKDGTNAPVPVTSGNKDEGSNCAESPSTAGLNFPVVSESEPDPSLKLPLQQKHELVSKTISSMSQQESECQSTEASSVQNSDAVAGLLHLSLDDCEFKSAGIDYQSVENFAPAEETAIKFNPSEDLLVAECVEEQVNSSVFCCDTLALETGRDSLLTFKESSLLTQTGEGVTVALPVVTESTVQLEMQDQNSASKLQDLQEEQTTYTSKVDDPPRLTGSENREGPVDSVTRNCTRRRKRRRRRKKKSHGAAQVDFASGHIANSAAWSPLTRESAVPLPCVSAATSSAEKGTNELRVEELRVDTKDVYRLETVGWDQPKEYTERDVPSNVEEKVNTEPPTTGVVSSKEEVADKEEREKVEVKEADKIIKKADDQVTEVPEDLGQETQEKPMEKRKKATKSGDKARHELIMSNLDSSKSFSELQIAVIRFFVEKQLSITSVGIRKSRKLGQVTFLTRKDLIQALQSNGEELLGRPLQLIRPEWIEKSLATDHGKKRKLTELDQDSAVPSLAKKKRIQKSSVLIKSRKNSTFLIRKRKSSVVSTKKSRKNSLSPIEREKSITGVEKDGELNKPLQKKKKKKKMQEEGEKKQAEESCTLSSPQKKRKLEETILDDSEDKAAVLQKKKKKKLEKALVKEEREVEKEDACLPPKKKKHQEMAVLNKEKDRKKEAAPQKKKNKASWCLYLQNIGFQQKHSKIKASIGNFLKEKSISYKEIVLHPSRCSACIELHCEEDVDKALKFDECTIIGEAVKLNKVVKLGALEAESRRTLYIRSLPREVSAKNLKKLFEKVAGVWIQENQKSTKRFALIAFKTTEAADGALSKSEIECKGNLIQLQSVHQRSKEKKKILMVNNLPRPLSKTYLKSLFTDAKDIRISDESDCPAHGVAYIEYKTAKQAKAALKRFKKKGVQGQVIQVDSLEAKKEKPEKSLIQGAKEKKQGKKITEAKKEGSLERRLPAPCDSLFVQNLSSKAALDDLRSTFKGSIGAKIQSSKKQY